jgi:squalene-hopene/tetraprenyl-beta-curcumene cyclase
MYKWAVPIAAILSVAAGASGCSRQAAANGVPSWDERGAAAYLDRRIEWWASWPTAARDHGTFCVSCHTAVPYTMARPVLDRALGQSAPSADERRTLEDVRRRVRLRSESDPFYFDDPRVPGKTAESRGTEAVLNALILAWNDARSGHLSADGSSAFAHMWQQQLTSGKSEGAWAWLNFTLAPWEISDSQYYGAAMAALAVGVAPDGYAQRADIQQPLARLRDYLQREYAAQPLHHRLVLLWADTRLPGLLDPATRRQLISDALAAQNADGGWSLSALAPGTAAQPLRHDPDSDGYATGLVTLVLEQAAAAQAQPAVQRGRAWLVANQAGHNGSWLRGREEFWVSESLNKDRNPRSNVGRFMSDAATAYAVMALTQPAPATP